MNNSRLMLKRLARIRWATRFTLAFGVTASGVANVLHANDNLISRAISAWPPLALLLTVELITRVPATTWWRALIRIAATTVIAGIAGWISYWHMAAVTATYGETGSSAYLLPLTVDGLVVVASISLVELTSRIRDLENPAPAPETPTATAVTATPVSKPAPATVSIAATVPSSGRQGGNEDRSLAVSRKARPVTGTAGGGVSDWLQNRARKVIATYRDQTGRDITRDELRERLRIKTETASQLLHLLRPAPAPIEPVPAVEAELVPAVEVEPVEPFPAVAVVHPSPVPAVGTLPPVVNRALIGTVAR